MRDAKPHKGDIRSSTDTVPSPNGTTFDLLMLARQMEIVEEPTERLVQLRNLSGYDPGDRFLKSDDYSPHILAEVANSLRIESKPGQCLEHSTGIVSASAGDPLINSQDAAAQTIGTVTLSTPAALTAVLTAINSLPATWSLQTQVAQDVRIMLDEPWYSNGGSPDYLKSAEPHIEHGIVTPYQRQVGSPSTAAPPFEEAFLNSSNTITASKHGEGMLPSTTSSLDQKVHALDTNLNGTPDAVNRTSFLKAEAPSDSHASPGVPAFISGVSQTVDHSTEMNGAIQSLNLASTALLHPPLASVGLSIVPPTYSAHQNSSPVLTGKQASSDMMPAESFDLVRGTGSHLQEGPIYIADLVEPRSNDPLPTTTNEVGSNVEPPANPALELSEGNPPIIAPDLGSSVVAPQVGLVEPNTLPAAPEPVVDQASLEPPVPPTEPTITLVPAPSLDLSGASSLILVTPPLEAHEAPPASDTVAVPNDPGSSPTVQPPVVPTVSSFKLNVAEPDLFSATSSTLLENPSSNLVTADAGSVQPTRPPLEHVYLTEATSTTVGATLAGEVPPEVVDRFAALATLDRTVSYITEPAITYTLPISNVDPYISVLILQALGSSPEAGLYSHPKDEQESGHRLPIGAVEQQTSEAEHFGLPEESAGEQTVGRQVNSADAGLERYFEEHGQVGIYPQHVDY